MQFKVNRYATFARYAFTKDIVHNGTRIDGIELLAHNTVSVTFCCVNQTLRYYGGKYLRSWYALYAANNEWWPNHPISIFINCDTQNYNACTRVYERAWKKGVYNENKNRNSTRTS